MVEQEKEPITADTTESFTRKDLTARQWLLFNLAQAPPEPLEFLFGLLLVFWGFWVMVPWWDAFTLAPSVWRVLMAILPDEFAWGSLSLLLGLVLLRALYHDDRLARYACSVCLTSLWSAFDLSFWFSDWRSPAGVWYLWMALAAAWLTRINRLRWLSERARRVVPEHARRQGGV